jgi:NADPH-dependent curcumin reductase CurA
VARRPESAAVNNRFWRILPRPEGTDSAGALELVEGPLAPLAEGEIRIRNSHLSIDAGTRLWLTDREDGYQPPLPLGGAMTGLVLDVVVESRAASFAPGDLVRAFGQWADLSAVDAAQSAAIVLDRSVADRRAWFGPLGMNGWSALWGVERIGAAKPGEKVLVSAAAGATGMLAVQIAKLLGCEAWGSRAGRRSAHTSRRSWASRARSITRRRTWPRSSMSQGALKSILTMSAERCSIRCSPA